MLYGWHKSQKGVGVSRSVDSIIIFPSPLPSACIPSTHLASMPFPVEGRRGKGRQSMYNLTSTHLNPAWSMYILGTPELAYLGVVKMLSFFRDT